MNGVNEQRELIRVTRQTLANPSRLDKTKRRSLQRTLEAALHFVAQAEESARVTQVQRDAVASGLVVTPTVMVSDCVCHETMTASSGHLQDCCGAYICMLCSWKLDRGHRRTCPSCRSAPLSKHQVHVAQLKHAQAGQAWAQYQVGLRLWNGVSVPKNETQGLYWFRVAAQQGHVDAMGRLGGMYYNGHGGIIVVISEWFVSVCYTVVHDHAGDSLDIRTFRENIITIVKNMSTAWEWSLQAARQGHASAQAVCAVLVSQQGKPNDELIWNTLAAAQGHPNAQESLGEWLALKSPSSITNDTYKALYWYQKAALQGSWMSQARLSFLVAQVKASIFDGTYDEVGNSAEPESMFWGRLVKESIKRNGLTHFEIGKIPKGAASCDQCACCGQRSNSTTQIELKRCVQCTSIRYCSKQCQVKHWKLGHKVDCQKVAALQERYQTRL